jgi:hypothetical protein
MACKRLSIIVMDVYKVRDSVNSRSFSFIHCDCMTRQVSAMGIKIPQDSNDKLTTTIFAESHAVCPRVVQTTS